LPGVEPEAPTKTCPDCAETVLAAARVCRHCGYRFEAPPRAAPDTRLPPALAWIRPVTQDGTLAEQLERWGIELAHGEVAGRLLLCTVDSRLGYLTVTNRRIVFVAPEHRKAGPQRTRALTLTELETVRYERTGRLLGKTVVTLEAGPASIVVHDLSAKNLQALRDALPPAVQAGGS
jgi:hypothetical protein